MIRDEDLRSSLDYSEGQKEAARDYGIESGFAANKKQL